MKGRSGPDSGPPDKNNPSSSKPVKTISNGRIYPVSKDSTVHLDILSPATSRPPTSTANRQQAGRLPRGKGGGGDADDDFVEKEFSEFKTELETPRSKPHAGSKNIQLLKDQAGAAGNQSPRNKIHPLSESSVS